ncbi:MAG: hypothetical protein MUC94_06660 [bacterium]|nr:hypothetical protein [bacterium]
MNQKMINQLCRSKHFMIAFLLFFLATNSAIRANDKTTSAQQSDTTDLNLNTQFLRNQLWGQLPFRGAPQEYYGLFPGVVRQDFRGIENLHVRGSRPDEVAYSFEGADIRSAYTGRNLFRIIPEALDRIELHTNPSASSSYASALFEHRLRRGGENFSLKLRGESDRFTHSFEQRLGTFSYGYYNLLLLSEGKLFKDNIRFFVAGEGESFADHYRKFWDGFSIGGPEFPLVNKNDGRSLYQIAGADRITIRPGNLPHANADQFTLNGIIEADYTPFVFRMIGLYNDEKQQQNDTPIYHVFNPRRIPVLEQYAGLLSLQMDYAGAKNLNAHFQLDWLGSGHKNYDPLFGDNFWLYRDSLAIIAKGLPWETQSSLTQFYDSYIIGPEDLNFYWFYFSSPGDIIAAYSKSIENYWAISGSVQKKIGQHHLNFGAAFQRRTLRQFTIGNSLQYMNEYRKLEKVNGSYDPDQLLQMRNWGEVDAFGFDIFGNKIDKTDEVNDGPRHPINYSFYLEDQFISGNLQIDQGLRYDSFSSDEPIFPNPTNPDVIDVWYTSTGCFAPAANILPQAMIKSSSHNYLQPRLGASFLINDRLRLNVDWGKYAQQVRFSDVYSSRAFHYKHFLGGYFNNDPHSTDAKPVTSTQAQAGISYQALYHLNIGAVVFHKITEGHLQCDRIVADPSSYISNYFILTNNGEAIAKGLELSLQYNNRGFASFLNYTLSDIRGFNSYPISNLAEVEHGINDSNPPETQAQKKSTLDYNQRHRINALLSYEVNETKSNWLAGTGFYLLFRFNSGHNFTLYEGPFGPYGAYLGSLLHDADPRWRTEAAHIITPWNYQFDFKLDRQFLFGGIGVTAFVYIQNLLNTKNVLHVYWRTGATSEDGSFDLCPGSKEIFIENLGEEFFVLYNLINLQHRQHYQMQQGGDLFGRPREIRFGFQIEL